MRRVVHIHRVRFGVAHGLGELFDEFIATLMVAGWEGSVADRVELGLVQATTAVDVRRCRQAVACRVERRHNEEG